MSEGKRGERVLAGQVVLAVGQPAGVGGPVLADNLPVLDELDVLLPLEKR